MAQRTTPKFSPKTQENSSKNSFLTSKWLWLLALLFLASRAYIWVFKPPAFSEIIYSYMPYAHLWASGTRPYLDQWYEYPPATIPLFYVPHLIDMATHPTAFHINYSNAYRGILLIVDVILFTLIWKVLRKWQVKAEIFVTAILYYIFITAKANHFIYDTMDLTFSAAMTLGVVAPVLWSKHFKTFGTWLGYFLATALKYVNAPLAAFYAVLELPASPLLDVFYAWPVNVSKVLNNSLEYVGQLFKSGWILKTGLSILVAAVLIWAAPVALYRSSLQVSLLYHEIRGLQIDSTPAIFVRTVNSFTKTEQPIEIYKNYEITGPLSKTALSITNVIFPISFVLFGIFALVLIWRSKLDSDVKDELRVWLTLGFVLLFMLTAKVLSRPFLLWHIPLLAVIPFKTRRQQLAFMIPSYLIIFTSLSAAPNWQIGPFPLPLLVGWVRVICFAMMFVFWVKNVWNLSNKVKV